MIRDSRFGTNCLIKLLVSVEILMLAEQGKIDLDSGVAEYLPELGGAGKAKGHVIKIKHLLSHTSGYRGFYIKQLLSRAHESWQNCVDMFQAADQLFESGTVFNDENMDHIILGRVVAHLRGRPILDVVTQRFCCRWVFHRAIAPATPAFRKSMPTATHSCRTKRSGRKPRMLIALPT